jgi:NAD(P)-dependent dehydrogenase (short-subunit alcohol dehydrogenase family)
VPNVLITGCSAGIGKATALRLARAGHRVFASMRNPERAPDLAERARIEQLPLSVHQLDVDVDASVAAAFDGIKEPLDVLVNNAGLGIAGAVPELPLSAFRASMETNYLGPLRCIHAVLPRMQQAGRGCIVNVSSVAGRAWCAPFGPYAPSKAALEALSEILAGELRNQNIRVAIVQPGVIDTAMAHHVETLAPSTYPQSARFGELFRMALSAPVSPDVVAETIQHIIESDTLQVRHLSGPTAAPLLAWRLASSDEEWVATSAKSDTDWWADIGRHLGVAPER